MSILLPNDMLTLQNLKKIIFKTTSTLVLAIENIFYKY